MLAPLQPWRPPARSGRTPPIDPQNEKARVKGITASALRGAVTAGRANRVLPRWIAVCVTVLCAVGAASWANAHEIPTDVVIHAYVVPASDRVDLLVRVPFEAMRDLDVPVRGPGYIDIPAARPLLADAAETWLVNFLTLRLDERRLDDWRLEAARLSLPSDRSFRALESARNHLAGRLDDGTDIYRDQALMDIWLSYPAAATEAAIAIEPRFARLGLRTTTVVNFIPEEGVRRVFEFSGDPGIVPLDPRWHQAFLHFVRLGVEHILAGVDHILFLLCLIVPFRRWRPLVAIVTAFTVAHSITLVASVLGLAPRAPWFPPLIETLIAASIVYMAIENLVGTRWHRRWAIAFAFGLVHGFGFSFALGETLQFAGRHLATSLFAFNLGVELGQLLLVVIAVPVLNLAFRTARAERLGVLILSLLLAHSGWHWMTDRAAELASIGFGTLSMDAALLAGFMRLLMLALIVGIAVWVMRLLAARLAASETDAPQGREPPLG